MRNILNIVDNHLFAFESVDSEDWEIITDPKQAEHYLAEKTWLHLRQENSQTLDYDEKEWQAITNDIRKLLKRKNYTHFDGVVEADLLNCHLNIKHRLKNPLWNVIFKAYKKGVFPCGWQGEYPAGKLVVFHPTYKPTNAKILTETVVKFFETLNFLVEIPKNLEKLMNLFVETAEIHTEKGISIIGKAEIEPFYQKIASENAQMCYLWQKTRSNDADYYEVRFGCVLKTKNGAIQTHSGTMSFRISDEKIHRIEITK